MGKPGFKLIYITPKKTLKPPNLYILRGFRKLVIVFFTVKNTPT